MNTGLNTATFELPLSADTLYLFSRGALGKGIVSYQVDPTLANDIVKVTIIVTHRSSETAGVVTLCSMERVPGERGIGIFVSACDNIHVSGSVRLSALTDPGEVV